MTVYRRLTLLLQSTEVEKNGPDCLFTLQPNDACCGIYLFRNVDYCVISSGVEERLPWRGRPHGYPDGRLWLHHRVGAERAIGRMLAEHVQAAQLLLPHLRSHWNPGEKLPRELPLRWESASSSQPLIPFFSLPMHFLFFHLPPTCCFFKDHTLFLFPFLPFVSIWTFYFASAVVSQFSLDLNCRSCCLYNCFIHQTLKCF